MHKFYLLLMSILTPKSTEASLNCQIMAITNDLICLLRVLAYSSELLESNHKGGESEPLFELVITVIELVLTECEGSPICAGIVPGLTEKPRNGNTSVN